MDQNQSPAEEPKEEQERDLTLPELNQAFQSVYKATRQLKDLMEQHFIPMKQSFDSISQSFFEMRLRLATAIKIMTPEQKELYDQTLKDMTVAQRKAQVFLNFVNRYINEIPPSIKKSRHDWASGFLNGFEKTGDVTNLEDTLSFFSKEDASNEVKELTAEEFFTTENLGKVASAIPSLDLSLV